MPITIGDGQIAEAIGKRFPIAGAILGVLGPAAVTVIQESKTPEELGAKLEQVAKTNPEIVNNLNLEHPLQSGTTLGMGGALLTAAGALWALIQAGNFDPALMGPLIAAILFNVFGLWRRWAPNLPPIFGGKK